MKKQKDHYTYYFADGTKSVVTAKEFGQEWINILWAMHKDEFNQNRAETRRHVSIESLIEANNEPSVTDEYPDEEMFGEVHDVGLKAVLSGLTEKQKELLYDVAVLRIPQKEIAERDGMSITAINNCYIRIIKKFQNYFSENVDFCPFPWLIGVGVENEPPANLKKE